MQKQTAILLALLATGCAGLGTDGVVEIGPNTYMVGGLGGFTDFSSSAVKARYFKQASQFCSEKGMTMQPLNSTGQDSGIATYASAEVQFRCVQSKSN